MGLDQFLDKLEENDMPYRGAGIAWYDNSKHYNDSIEIDELIDEFNHSFLGYYDSIEDFAYEFLQETMDIPKEVENYFDYDKWIKDFQANGGWYSIIQPAKIDDPVKVAVFNV